MSEYKYTEDSCPGHVASLTDNKICAHCGIHIDSLRPQEEDTELTCEKSS